jgi:hypothetical protein
MHAPGENREVRDHPSRIRRKARFRWYPYALLGVMLVLAVLFCPDDGPACWPKTAFEPQKWAETKEDERYVFVNELIDGKS